MIKYHNYISIAIGLLFMMVLQEFSLPQPVFRFIVPAVLIFSLAVAAYNYWYLKQLQKYNFWVLLRQFLMFLSAFCVFTLIPSSGFKGLFLVITVLLVALFEYALGSFVENMLINQTLITAFGFFVGLAAYSQYFPNFRLSPVLGKFPPVWQVSLQPIYVLAVFAVTLLLARSFYEFIPHSARVKMLNSLAIALFCTEAFWALTFLPFHYSALAVLLFNLFYFCLILNYYHLFQILNFKKIQFHLLLILLCSCLVLLITPWKVIG
jgi:hypothetical protein